MFEMGTDVLKVDPENGEEAIELCALMGLSASHVILSDGFDSRVFNMGSPTKEGNILRFFIPNKSQNQTEVMWKNQTRIIVASEHQEASATIESTIARGNQLMIAARLAKADTNFQLSAGVNIVFQKPNSLKRSLTAGFLKNLPIDCNARKIIQTLYGGPSLDCPLKATPSQFVFFSKPQLRLNRYQNEYISRILEGTPLTIGSAPFGCGKSVTIAAAALYSLSRSRNEGIPAENLLITQSNFAAINLIEICQRFHFDFHPPTIVRFVSEANWDEMPESGRTQLDLPLLMRNLFLSCALGCHPVLEPDLVQMVIYLMSRKLIRFENLSPYLQLLCEKNQAFAYSFANLVKIYFSLVKPEIIVATSDTLQHILPLLENVTTVQIDEASQLPESTLIYLLSSTPTAAFGLVGDINQLPPFCTSSLTGRLKRFGIGNTMERAIINRLFPTVTLQSVYRCHPKTTQLLCSLFYDYVLESGVREEERNAFLRYRPDVWPCPAYPVAIVDNKTLPRLFGTSWGNEGEMEIVVRLVTRLMTPLNGYALAPNDIGVISFYKAQESLLNERLRNTGIKCGTVDSFQGSEREVMILCFTNNGMTEFMTNRHRINVSLSRSKQATFIIANASVMDGDPLWRTIKRQVKDHGCLIITN